MKYINTKNKFEAINFQEAIFQNKSENGGLYMPANIPEFGPLFIHSLSRMTNTEIACEIMLPYVREFINRENLMKIAERTLNFKIPLIQVEDNIYSLELFHGPSMAFKDIGARFLASFLQELKRDHEKTRIIVATSGDTGSAVAKAFSDKVGFEVYVLYPKDGVSKFQEQQINCNAKNVVPIEVNGTFDDCQKMIKYVLQNKLISKELNILTANSINIGRLLPQIIYYFLAYKQLSNKNRDLVVSVPCGNLGNLTAALMAQKMGLPINKFVGAVNNNKVFYNFLKYGKLEIKPSEKTYSNAMDVGNPSNLQRIMYLYNHDILKMIEDISTKSVSNKITINRINKVYKEHNYILDPHGAVAYEALKSKLKDYQTGMFLATADPAKFESVVRKAIPNFNNHHANEFRTENKIKIKNDFNKLKQVLYS
jgi:threonine synthase